MTARIDAYILFPRWFSFTGAPKTTPVGYQRRREHTPRLWRAQYWVSWLTLQEPAHLKTGTWILGCRRLWSL